MAFNFFHAGLGLHSGTKIQGNHFQCLDRSAKRVAPVNAISVQDGPVVLNKETLKMHSLSAEGMECIQSMQDEFENEILPLLTPTKDCWQPQDFLPDPNEEDFLHSLEELQSRIQDVPDELFCVLVGDMITEEALPTYMAMLNTLDGVRDETGASPSPYARWTRQWVAEENRHGDLLNKYLWLTGRINMHSCEQTIQNLIGSGMNPQTENNPYLCFIFTSFQERATKISHGGTARIAKAAGDETLAKICGVIASDEARHEVAYTRTVNGIFRRDPSGAMLAFADMMKKKITMPAHFMDDGCHGIQNNGRNLFEDFAFVAEDIDVYTPDDYINIMEHLIKIWNINSLQGLSVDALQAQEYVCGLPERFRKVANHKATRRKKNKRQPVKFSWLNGRDLNVL